MHERHAKPGGQAIVAQHTNENTLALTCRRLLTEFIKRRTKTCAVTFKLLIITGVLYTLTVYAIAP
ncbi:hypothetical protein GCM10010919_00740 [Alishewanella longhuensis]|uniref:Uncharacterized protein n=1 Tax=Alishewanella longhuensis TaxID=1091037 RepID=A0ABQ3KT86_9ALTE|nr:hypothetical protein GCM10010919_00740 [Alishewanella longhuensis]